MVPQRVLNKKEVSERSASTVKKVRVKILSQGNIPFIGGNGPILKPIYILETEYNVLCTLGYKVVLAPLKPTTTTSPQEVTENPETSVEDLLSSVAPEEVPLDDEIPSDAETLNEVPEEVPSEVTPAADEEPLDDELPTEEEDAEILVDDEDLSAEAFYNLDFLTKKKAITILENRGVEHNPNDNADPLKTLVMESNPEVE